jgi:flagellar biosynthesis chaperone FliJ
MPKNYRALTKLRKREFERAEQALAVVNYRLEELKRKRDMLREDERSTVLPTAGKGADVAGVLAQKRSIQRLLKAVEEQIESLKRMKEQRQAELKAANIAYEQAKSIESKVVEEILKRERRRTQNGLDEIASQQFWRLNTPKKDYG